MLRGGVTNGKGGGLRSQMQERRRPQFLRSSSKPSESGKTGGGSRMDPSGSAIPLSAPTNRDSDELPSGDSLARQNLELRHRLEEEAVSYKRRLETYRQAQQHQAVLVSRLQAKVLQYKQRCSELENQMTESLGPEMSRGTTGSASTALDAAHRTLRDLRDSEQIKDIETALRKLADERRRSEKLLEVNAALKSQLDESHHTNEALTNDLEKLSNDWDVLREEMAIKEDEWKEEELAFNEYYTSEHNRLLNLWRDVVSLKRYFSDIKSTTERDLGKYHSRLSSISNEMNAACNAVNLSMLATTSLDSTILQTSRESTSDLRGEMFALRQSHDAALNELRTKEERINQLIREIHNLEARCGEAEAGIEQAAKIQEDSEILESALRDIAHAVIQDAESRDMESCQAPPHVHLSPSTSSRPQRSPKRSSRGNTVPAFAESTISAVQAALHKYQLTIHELQVKLQTNKEQLSITQKQCDVAEENIELLEAKTNELIVQLDSAKAHANLLTQEKDMLQKSFDSVRTEKNNLEKAKIESNHTIDTLNNECEKLQKMNNKLQKLCDSLEDDKIYYQGELDRINKDSELREINFRSEEERCSRMREELLSLREELSRAHLAKDMLEQQKIETDGLITQIEKSKVDVELELERVLLEKSDVQDDLMKVEAISANHENEKMRLQEELKKLTEEKKILANQSSDQLNDLSSLRKELLQTEQTRLDLESDKVALNEKLKFLEIEKEKVEMELGQVSRERGDLSNQLSIMARKKESLNEELMRLGQRLEQANEMNARINRNLEDLVKDNEEKQVLLETNEKEFQRIQETLASLRSEKETLEAVLFDAQTNLEATHTKKVQLEKEQQELLVKQENYKGQVSRLSRDLENSEKRAQDMKQNFAQQRANQEAEFQQIVVNFKKQNEDNARKLMDEKEQVRAALEKRLEQTVGQISGQKDDEISQLQQRIEDLERHIENLSEQHEEVLLRAENDKQQALLIAHHDQQALMEKLENLYRKLEEEQGNLDRTRRESAARADQERNSMNQLRDELNRSKARLDETKLRTDEERMQLQLKIEDTINEKEAHEKDCEELRVQLHVSEDRIENLSRQLHETSRKLKDSENGIDSLRKELMDVRRQLADSNFAMDKYSGTNKELREHVKRIESEKREQTRSLEESYQKISALEEARGGMETEKARFQTQIRDMEHERMELQQQIRLTQEELQKSRTTNNQSQNEERELQARLANEIEERERLQLQLHQAKKQLVDLDNNLEMTRQELGKVRARADEEDERWRSREQELLMRLEDGRCRERKLEDQKHNLEVCLADASQQLQELKARLGGSEGRVRALDVQLSQLEMAKKEIEQKYSSVGSALRRIAGIQVDGSVNMPFKLSGVASPSRRWSPARHHQDHETAMDPEAVKKGVRCLMQQVALIERERDDLRIEASGLKKQVAEAQESIAKYEARVSHSGANLRALQDEKGCLEAKLSQKEAAFIAQYETLRENCEESERLKERVASLELLASNESEERAQYEEKLDKMKQAFNRLENDKRCLQEELARNEARSTKLELQRMSLEGDVQRLRMMLQEKDANLEKLQDRMETQCRTGTNLEERCASLKSTIEQLNIALERSSQSESELKGEIDALRRAYAETNAHSHSNNEKYKQLQKQFSATENERRVLTERLDSMQKTLVELKHVNENLNDQIARLQNDLANNEVQRSGLEAQLRLASWPQDSPSNKDDEIARQLHCVQRERSEMRGKLDALSDKVRLLEADKRNLERQLSSARVGVRSKSYERPEKTSVEMIGTSISGDHFELENRDLRLKIRRLETLIAEKEAARSSHSILDSSRERLCEIERLRAAQLQAEKLLEARELSHRQQVLRLENQIKLLREQLNQEIKRRQLYVLRSSRAGKEMQHLRQALGDSLRTVSQDPSIDAMLLEHEARKLDSTVTSTASLPPSLALPPPSSSPLD